MSLDGEVGKTPDPLVSAIIKPVKVEDISDPAKCRSIILLLLQLLGSWCRMGHGEGPVGAGEGKDTELGHLLHLLGSAPRHSRYRQFLLNHVGF